MLSAGTSAGTLDQRTCIWPIHVAWASLQHGGLKAPNVGVLTNMSEAALPEVVQCHFHIFFKLAIKDSQSHLDAKGGELKDVLEEPGDGKYC